MGLRIILDHPSHTKVHELFGALFRKQILKLGSRNFGDLKATKSSLLLIH